MGDEYKISVKSYEVFDPLVTEPAVHNEIVFSKNGQAVFAFNGDAWDREKGEIRFPSTSGEDTLRTRIFVGASLEDLLEQAGKTEEFPLIAENTLFVGTEEEVSEKLAQAMEAAEFINHQNMDYVIIGGLFSHAQNSNSVAHTLTHAMGLKYPPEAENLWAPGHDRILLSKDWKSSMEGKSIEEQVAYMRETIEKLVPQYVAEQVKKDDNPYHEDQQKVAEQAFHGKSSSYDDNKSPGQLFDPDNAKAVPVAPEEEQKIAQAQTDIDPPVPGGSP